jgi:hypothetical protein
VECPEILLAREKQELKKELPKDESTPKSDKSSVSYLSAIFIINLLMSQLLGHRPSLWITHMENGS